MKVTLISLIICIGITTAVHRNIMITYVLSDGLQVLEKFSEYEVRHVCTSYTNRAVDPFPIILYRVQQQRMKSLDISVKDMTRVLQVPKLPNVTVCADIIDALK